jgi:hypothetical protein
MKSSAQMALTVEGAISSWRGRSGSLRLVRRF